MSATVTIEYRPTKRTPDRPWVIRMKTSVTPITVARCESEEQARKAAEMVGLTIAEAVTQ